MLNILHDYYPHSVPDWLETAPGLAAKANRFGILLLFPGNTVVFLLKEETKQQLQDLQSRLHQLCGDMLAQPLVPDTFHMTLHDLANGDLLPRQEEMAAGTRTILAQIREEQHPDIPMKATWMFNMVNTSIVLGLEPANADAWHQLSSLYQRFQQIRPLPYALTPHITLAYFRPGCYGPEQTAQLRAALGPVELTTELLIQNLVLQDFADMNHYTTIF